MSQSLLLYRRADADGDPAELGERLADRLGALGVAWGCGVAGYRPGTWSDAATRARCTLDLGTPPLEEDREHPPTAYDGWTAAGLAFKIPLAGPHWHAVECYRLVEAALAVDDALAALDEEDTRADGAPSSGPAAWDRARAVWSWERQREAQAAGLALPRLGRMASVVLWRWRREADAGRPALAVVEDRRRAGRALLAGVVAEPDAPIVLPAVDVVLLRTAGGLRLVAGERLAGAPGSDLGAGIRRYAGLAGLAAAGDLIAPERLRLLADEDWRD